MRLLVPGIFLLAAVSGRCAMPGGAAETLKVELKGVFTAKPLAPNASLVPVCMGLWTHGLPSHQIVTVRRSEVSLQLQSGEALPVESLSLTEPGSDPDAGAVQAALGETKLFAVNFREYAIVPVFAMRSDLLAKYWTNWLKFQATVEFQTAAYVRKAEFPLGNQTGERLGALGTETIRLARSKESVAVRISQTGKPSDTPSPERVLVLENPSRREALLGKRAVLIKATSGEFVPSPEWHFENSDSPTGQILTDAWLANARLVVFALEKGERFSRTFQIDPFELSYDIPAQLGRVSDTDPASLEKITLPAGASKEQVRAYVSALVALSRAQKTSGYNDPQTAMLLKVGPSHLDVLMDAAPIPRTPKDLHLWKAMREIVRKTPTAAHREEILARLERNPDLVELFVQQDWTEPSVLEAARPILIKALRDGRSDLPASWIRAVLAFRQPDTYPAIFAYYEKNPAEPGLYDEVRRLPGADFSSVMERAWRKAREGSVRDQSFVIHPACEWGCMDALSTAADWLRPPASDYQKRVGRAVLKKYTPAEGTDAEILEWFDTNQQTLVFDRDRKMFLPKPQ
jgi:hypothetical protein